MRATLHGPSRVELAGTKEEMDAVMGMLAGAHYLGNPAYGPLIVDKHQPPDLSPDPEVCEFFPHRVKPGFYKIPSKYGDLELSADQLALPMDVDARVIDDPNCVHSFYVSGISGYSSGVYEERAALLTTAGFCIMRSPRDEQGQFWEKWYLPGAWAFKLNRSATTEDVMKWLVRVVRPGSIDLVRQKLALVAE